MEGAQTITGLLTAGGASVALFAVRYVRDRASALLKREVAEERTRLRTEVLGEVLVPSEAAGEAREEPPEQTDATPAEHRFAALLIDYYAYGLIQARRSFGVSLTCSVLGGLVLIIGVVLAIFRADSNGQQYASIVASSAGVLTTAVGTLFHRRADLALKHMESQTQSLRQDMKVERDAGQAIQLLGEVDDPALKAHLQAALILKFSAAKLPELTNVLRGDMLSPRAPSGGVVPQRPGSAAP
jgi:hypothetical protein